MNQTVLIAGGGSGIGLETVKRLSGRGSQIICATRSPEKLSGQPDITTIPFNAEDPAPDLDLPDVLDGAVYFPGTISLKPFQTLKSDDFLRDLEVNFLGATRFLREALPSLKRSSSASVVLFSTVAVQTGLPFHASIAAAKGAVEGLTRSLAAEWAPKIRVNAIAPSLTNTPLAARLLGADAKIEAAGERHPLKKIGDPADIAELVDLLLSDASKFITGQILKVDGGLSSVRTF
ncbi:MAG: 3-oxoacyl-[acyl-carrier protein] reductase [Verrucomicrobiales bacterium]|jgi:3-oxoacyl-[acyl-carrier protein] reductase